MHPIMGGNTHRTRSLLMGTTLLAGIAAFVAPTAALAQAGGGMEVVTVTGYRASLEDATNAKRASVNFTDTVFAEDIGKFPDTNVAEALNRIPGVTISREIDGEGVNVSIRGLGTNFTKILLNNAAVAVASTGATDSSNNNREVDLNMFPAELFTQLQVSKTPSADQLEGGAAGTVNMRSARPFDNEGLHFSYNVQGQDQTQDGAIGKRGTLVVSDTDGPFGLLIGLSGVQNNVLVKGWEDGNGGWVPPNLSAADCGTGNTCNQIGGATVPIAATVPAGVSIGIPAGYTLAPGWTAAAGNNFPTNYPVNAGMLYALNPGLGTTQNQAMTMLSNALLPRLGRSMFEEGTRDRYNAVLSAEYRPTDSLHFYFDFIFGRTFNNLNRSDIDIGLRNGAGAQPMIPIGTTINAASHAFIGGNNGGVVSGTTLADAQFFLEARPYMEKGDFVSLNPGASWEVTDLFHIDAQVNASRSHFFRDSPTVFVTTCTSAPVPTGVTGCAPPTGGVNATFVNSGAGTPPVITSNLDLNNPANYQWSNSILSGNMGRVNLQDERRYTETTGAHLNLKYGGDEMAIKVGGAYDQIFRNITAIDASQEWQNAICGDNPSVYIPGTAYSPACQGIVSANPNSLEPTSVAHPAWAGQGGVGSQPAGTLPVYPTWLGLGTHYTASMPATFTYQGSLVPQSALASYLKPGPTGFVTVNYNAIKAASNYYAFDQAAIKAMQGIGVPGTTATWPYSTSSNLGSTSGSFDERDWGLYANLDGQLHPGSRTLKYDIGLRWVETHQTIYSPTQVTAITATNATINSNGTYPAIYQTDGALYPAEYTFPGVKHTYQAFLPSFTLVYEVADDFLVRGSLSRTMTRPNPGQMISVLNFSDVQASSASVGNPGLKPFFSNNIDLGAEYYTGGEGYYGAAVFRKSIAGYNSSQVLTEPLSYLSQFGVTWTSLTTGQQAILTSDGCSDVPTCTHPITVTTQVNAPGLLTINGMEFDAVQPLDFLLADYGLKGFGLTGNVTILDANSSGTAPVHPTGVAPLSYNMTGYYENNGVMFRASYVWNARSYISGTNQQSVCLPPGSAPNCQNGAYLFAAPYGQMDASASLKLSTVFGQIPSDPELTFDLQNLFNAKQVTYDQFPSAVHSYYIKGQTFLLGLRGSW
jgi:TonB-dependent receptor